MNDRDALLRGIAEDPYDNARRLIFADWCDEHGDHERAEFIRMQVELEPIRDQYEIPRAVELHALEKKFRMGHQWLGEMPEGWNESETGGFVEFRRGFPDILHCPARTFLRFGSAIRSIHPTIRRVVMHCLNGWGERLAASPALSGLAELELACWYSDDDIKALAASSFLGKLQVLVLWMGRRIAETDDAALCRLAANGKAWPNLRELVLFDPPGDSEPAIRKLVASTNRTIKRKVARYQRGYPELFPLNASFYYDFPIAGRLADGRAAVVELDCGPGAHRDTIPRGLLVRTFDAGGAPTGESILLPLPAALAEIPLGDARNRDGLYTEVARKALGFEPGFIRVQGYALGEDFGPRRGHYDSWRLCGHPDDPDDPTDWNGDPDSCGFGRRIYHLVHDVEFVVGYDAWADKTGEVHST